MLEFFGVDLLDLWRGRLSLRRIGALVAVLLRRPGRSALAAVMDESAEWSTSDYLLARMSDALEVSNYLFLKANTSEEEGKKLTPPEPITRPGVEHEAPANTYSYASGEEVTSFFTQMSNL